MMRRLYTDSPYCQAAKMVGPLDRGRPLACEASSNDTFAYSPRILMFPRAA